MPRAKLREELLLAFEPDWFKRLSKDEQKQYLDAHPGSKLGHGPHSTQAPAPIRHSPNAHPVNHPAVQNALQPNSEERRKMSREVTQMGTKIVDFYRHMPYADRQRADLLVHKFTKNKPMSAQEVGALAHHLNTYQAWAKGLDEQKVGYGVLKGAGALGAMGLAASPVGAVGLALGSILLAGYAVKKGYPHALKALKHMGRSARGFARGGKPRASTPATRPAAAPPSAPSGAGRALPTPADIIPPSAGPRRGDHLAALMEELGSYFHGALWNNSTKGKLVNEFDPEQITPDTGMYDMLFASLSRIVKEAHLTPEQWKPLLAYTKRRF